MVEEDSWSGLNHVRERVKNINQEDRKKLRRGVKRETWEAPYCVFPRFLCSFVQNVSMF